VAAPTLSVDWPKFGRVADEHGVRAVLAVPLTVVGDGSVGGLNLYGTGAPFDDGDHRLAEAFAAQASVVVSNAIAYWRAFEQTRSLTAAMESRAVIEQAKGILMSAQRCTPDEAFDLLRRASQRENRKLRELATEIVQRTIEVG
jgi:GAF domain-containing protein